MAENESVSQDTDPKTRTNATSTQTSVR